ISHSGGARSRIRQSSLTFAFFRGQAAPACRVGRASSIHPANSQQVVRVGAIWKRYPWPIQHHPCHAPVAMETFEVGGLEMIPAMFRPCLFLIVLGDWKIWKH